MANHIHTLTIRAKDLQAQVDSAAQEIAEFRAFLLSAKFQGLDADGSRKDWIATADVQARLSGILQALTE